MTYIAHGSSVIAPSSNATLGDVLSERFETRVSVEIGSRKGRIVVEFATLDDLERVVGTMAPDALDAVRRADDGDRIQP